VTSERWTCAWRAVAGAVGMSLALGVLGCPDEAVETSGLDVVEKSTAPSVAWVAPNTLLLTARTPDRVWVIDRANGSAAELPELEDPRKVYPSPDGTKLLALLDGGQTLWVAEVRALRAGASDGVRIPAPPFPAESEEFFVRERTVAFWIEDNRAIVAQVNAEIAYEQCYLYTPGEPSLARIPACLEKLGLSGTGAGAPNRVVSLGDELYGFYHSDEGTAFITVAQLTPEGGVTEIVHEFQYPVRTEFDYGHVRTVEVFRDSTNDRLYLASGIRLDGQGRYLDPLDPASRSSIATLYVLEPGVGFLQTPQTLPFGYALRSVESGELAWIDRERGELCTAPPDRVPLCHPLPEGVDSALTGR
jgi:hypothetical protein